MKARTTSRTHHALAFTRLFILDRRHPFISPVSRDLRSPRAIVKTMAVHVDQVHLGKNAGQR